MAHHPILPLILALAIALPGFAAAAETARPSGTAQVELDLSNGAVKGFALPVRYESSRTLDPRNPQSRCQPPLIRELTFDIVELGPQLAATMTLSFDEKGRAQPLVMLAGPGGHQAMIDPGLTAESTPEEIARWAPRGQPERVGPDWRIDMSWDFEPAPKFDPDAPADWVASQDKPLPTAPVKWISAETGEPTDITIRRARIKADLRLPARYEMPRTGEIHPCP